MSAAYFIVSAAYFIVSVAYYYRSATMQCEFEIDLQVFLQNVVCLLSKTSSTYEAEARR